MRHLSGRRPPIKGYFRRCAGRGCGHVFGLLRGESSPPALMLSADPLPRSDQRAFLEEAARIAATEALARLIARMLQDQPPTEAQKSPPPIPSRRGAPPPPGRSRPRWGIAEADHDSISPARSRLRRRFGTRTATSTGPQGIDPRRLQNPSWKRLWLVRRRRARSLQPD